AGRRRPGPRRRSGRGCEAGRPGVWPWSPPGARRGPGRSRRRRSGTACPGCGPTGPGGATSPRRSRRARAGPARAGRSCPPPRGWPAPRLPDRAMPQPRFSPGWPARDHRPRPAPGSDVEADLEDVAVDDLVVLSLDPELPGLLGRVPGAEGQQLVPADHLGPDEPALQVRVDDAGALRRPRAGAERPRPRLLVPRGEEGPPAEEVVGGPGDAWQGPLPQAEAGQQLGPLAGLELRRLGLELHADGQHL